MSDVPTGAAYGLDVPTRPLEPAPGPTPDRDFSADSERSADSEQSADSDRSAGERARQVAEQGKQSAAQAAGEVKDTASQQAQRVAHEAKTQARSLASDVRGRVGEQARTQNDRLVGTIRETADQLDEMRGDRAGSPAATVVSRVADGGRQLADYLDRNGPEGVLREVQDFARRRPGAFLATALAAGFVVGRLGKGVVKADDSADHSADHSADDNKPSTDAFVSQEPASNAWANPAPSSTVGTEYAATGTGRPAVVADEYVADVPPLAEGPGGVR